VGQAPAILARLLRLVQTLEHLDLNHGSIAKYLTHLGHDTTAKAKTILNEADQIADELGLDDELLDGLVVRLDS
jgi:hypothetical protein